ncbi:MAG: hypothetical protein KDA52_16675 [Planctomycetaceae bacterium]|nr:hypothetical protein [Planctomycetaceae bacterium]
MRNKRKNKQWVTFDGNHKTAPPPPINLTPEQSEVLVEIYVEHVLPTGRCSDALSEDDELAELVAREFTHRTRRRVPSDVLVARLTRLRKRGLLPGVKDVSPAEEDGDIGFRDIDDVDEAFG